MVLQKQSQQELAKKMAFLMREIKKKIFKGTATAYNREVADFFITHPTGVGVTLQHFKPLSVDGSQSQQTIAIFDKGYPAVLQLGSQGTKSGYTYPYDSTNGTFVSFSEEPNLEDWARKNYNGFNSKLTGLIVGRESTTTFGEPVNQWVTQAGIELKTNPSTRMTILNELKTIKLK